MTTAPVSAPPRQEHRLAVYEPEPKPKPKPNAQPFLLEIEQIQSKMRQINHEHLWIDFPEFDRSFSFSSPSGSAPSHPRNWAAWSTSLLCLLPSLLLSDNSDEVKCRASSLSNRLSELLIKVSSEPGAVQQPGGRDHEAVKFVSQCLACYDTLSRQRDQVAALSKRPPRQAQKSGSAGPFPSSSSSSSFFPNLPLVEAPPPYPLSPQEDEDPDQDQDPDPDQDQDQEEREDRRKRKERAKPKPRCEPASKPAPDWVVFQVAKSKILATKGKLERESVLICGKHTIKTVALNDLVFVKDIDKHTLRGWGVVTHILRPPQGKKLVKLTFEKYHPFPPETNFSRVKSLLSEWFDFKRAICVVISEPSDRQLFRSLAPACDPLPKVP